MNGLLNRAKELRARLGIEARGAEEITFDAGSGVSAEDQKEILGEIERVARQSRISVTPEAFTVKAAKRGVLFPIVVNLGLLVVLVAGLAGLYVLFQRGESSIAKGEVGTVTAAGKLIEELKKESAAQLEQKNREIDSIQDRLSQLDKERQDLVATMDSRVRSREEELTKAMAAELEAERSRLQGQGLSDAEVTRRMADLEAQKSSEYNKALDAFRAQAEADRRKSEESLRALETEYTTSLSKANQERQQMLADSKKREEELRAEMAATTAALQTEKAQAENALATLSDRQKKEDLAAGQLVSLYAVARSAIASAEYDKAAQSLKAIRDYVSQADVAPLPGIAARRDTDIFVVETLTTYVASERERASTDTASLVALASAIAELRAKVADADRLSRAGKLVDAEKLYAQALEVLPEVARGHAFFTEQARSLEAARRETLAAGIARAEAAFAAGSWADALVLYREALAYLPLDANAVSLVASNLSAAGREDASARARRDQSGKSAPVLAAATQALADQRFEDALGAFLQVLSSYPQSDDAPRAVQGVSDSARGLSDRSAAALADRDTTWKRELDGAQARLTEAAKGNADLQARLDEATRSIATLQAETARLSRERDAEIADWKQRLASADQGRQAQADEAARVSKELASEQARSADLAAARAAADQARAQASATGTKADADRIRQLEQDLAAAKTAEQKARAELVAAEEAAKSQRTVEQQLATLPTAEQALTRALAADYQGFADRLAKLDPATLDSSVLDQGRAVSYRNTFFSTASMQQAFPGLLSAIKRYDDWYFADGRKDVIRIVTELTARPSAKERRAYYDQRLKLYQDQKDTSMVELLKKLEPLVSTVR